MRVPGVFKFLAIILLSSVFVFCGSQQGITRFAVSGYVTVAPDFSRLADVTLAFSGGYGSSNTSSDGTWAKSGLKGNVTISPKKSGWAFTPSSATVSADQTDVNFVASKLGSYNVAGHVKDFCGNPVQGVTIEFDQGLRPVTTGSGGEWAMLGLTATVTATPRKDGWTFSPDSLVITEETTGATFTGGFTVSGRVTDTLGNPVPYAILSFMGNSIPITANANGYWSKDQLSGTATVTVSKGGWTFWPDSCDVSAPDSGVDFSGTFFVGGRTKHPDGTPAGSVRIDFTGGHSSVYSGLDGRWLKTGLCGKVTVTPSFTACTFTPAGIEVSAPDSHVDFAETRH